MEFSVWFLQSGTETSNSFSLQASSDEEAREKFNAYLGETRPVWSQLIRVEPYKVLRNDGPGPWLDDFDFED